MNAERRTRPLRDEAGVSPAKVQALASAVASALSVLDEQGPAACYRHLDDGAGRVKGLGPSFFTKVMYFAAGADAGDGGPLILDRNVARALTTCEDWDWHRSGAWDFQQYQRYLDLAYGYAQAWTRRSGVRVTGDMIELALFREGQRLWKARARSAPGTLR